MLLGSRAVGDHHHDSDVDLMAVAPDDTAAAKADETLRNLLAGKYDVPVVNVTTITGGSSSAQCRWPHPGPRRLLATA